MDPLIGGALISGGASILNNAMNSVSVGIQNRQNMANWREQNEYNTPANQRKRLEQAGLAPQLAYGGGSGGGGQAGAAPAMQRNNLDFSQVGNIVSTYLDLKAKDAAIENTRQNTKTAVNVGEGIRLDNVGKSMIHDQTFSKDWSERDDDNNFTPHYRRYMYDLENTQKEGTRIGAQTKNIEQNTLVAGKQFDLLKIREQIDNASLDQLKTIGIIPNVDDGNTQEIKMLYYMITGEKMGPMSSKSGGILAKILGMLKGSGQASKVVKKGGDFFDDSLPKYQKPLRRKVHVIDNR